MGRNPGEVFYMLCLQFLGHVIMTRHERAKLVRHTVVALVIYWLPHASNVGNSIAELKEDHGEEYHPLTI